MAEKKLKKAVKSTTPTKSQKTNKAKSGCFCPYCDEEVRSLKLPFCESCGVAIRSCGVCHISLPAEAESCPQCGKKIE